MNQPTPSDPQEIGGVLQRVNQLGAATERFFSRVYGGLARRSEADSSRQARQDRRRELQTKIETARRVGEQNKQLQRNLEKREIELERLHGILAALPEGIIMQNMDGKLVFTNRAARQLLGTEDEAAQNELLDILDTYRDTTTLESEIVPLGEAQRIRVQNHILGAQIAAVANGQGERQGTMIILRDVTRDALADRLKDQFVTAISHELKTPMTVIKGMSEVIMNTEADTLPDRRLLEALSRNVDILDRMVVELLDVSEMSAGTFTIRRDPVELESLVWSVVNGAAPEVKRKRLEIMVFVRDADYLSFRGDEQHLRWALGHLVQNAIHYTEAGGYIVVSASLADEDPHSIAIEVEDSGVGIGEQDMPHIFERFYRGKARTNTGKLIDPRGLGQGLFIARTVAEAHGGFLALRSLAGEGSVFTMVLPVS